MFKHTTLKNLTYTFLTFALILATFTYSKLEAYAVTFPSINVTFDSTDESVIVDGIPAYSADGSIEYQLEGYLNYEKERCDTFCYAPHVRAYDEPSKMAYIFNWADAEFLLPCSGDYKFTAYVTARYIDATGTPVEESGPKTTIDITLHKKDESTNWGPGLPNTTVEIYDMNQIKGKDKTIKIEDPDYTWTIHGKDIERVPDANFSLKITANPDSFCNEGVDDFFGETLFEKINIEYDGEFGFKALLDYKIGTEYIGKYANLFYVVGDGTYEYVAGTVVDENGMATFTFTHASDYVLAITDVEYTGQELNPKPAETPEPTEAPTAAPATEIPSSDVATNTQQPIATINTQSVSSGNNTLIYIISGIVLIATVTLVVFLIKKKQ